MPRLWENLSPVEQFAWLPREERLKRLAAMTPQERTDLEFRWKGWNARPSQLPPPGEWDNWLVLAGRGFGKTRTGAEWVRANMCGPTPLTGGRWRHLAIIAETAADARDVMVGDGKQPSDPKAGSGILQVHPKDFLPHYEPSKRRLTWPNGAAATLYNAVEPEQLRGPQHDAAWCDELCKWRYQQETWDQLEFGMRTGKNPQKLISTTPKPTLLLKAIIADPATVITRGSTFDNAANLAAKFLGRIKRKYEGTRLGRQELEAEVLDDLEGALWKRSVIDQYRVKLADIPPLARVVVAIDPNASSEENSNECGIVCVGLGEDGHGYVLDDVSAVYSPSEWAAEAISLYYARRADRIVAEINNGGEMVENTIRSVDLNVSYSSVWASRGKFIRAEPVSSLYEQGRVHHVGGFPQLEDQMCSFTVDFDRNTMGYSPDRMDALVWALTELMVEGEQRRLLFTSA
jgi:phage terminase large subunit-like protein